jgi:hypothetical protein
MLVAAEDEILRSASPKLVLEMTLLAMATIGPAASLDAVLARLTGLAGEEAPPPAGARPAERPAERPADPPARPRDKIAPESGDSAGADAPPRAPAKRVEAEAAARREALENPVLKQVLDLFDGKIEDVRVEDRKR